MNEVVAYIGLGANLGDPPAALAAALAQIDALPGTRVRCRSSFYRSAPVDAAGPDYVNAVAEISSTLAPHDLLVQLQRIEREAGRERPYPHAPRTLDLDLLLYGEERIDTPALTVPHPRMHQRAFVLVPLAEIAPHRVRPEQLAAMTSQVIARMTPASDDGAINNGACND